MPQPSHSSRFITRTIFGEQYRSLCTSLCSFLHSLINSSLLGPNILLITPFSNSLRPRTSFHVSHQVSHLYTTKGKITVLYILIFIFLDNTLEGHSFCTCNCTRTVAGAELLHSSLTCYQITKQPALPFEHIPPNLRHAAVFLNLPATADRYIVSAVLQVPNRTLSAISEVRMIRKL